MKQKSIFTTLMGAFLAVESTIYIAFLALDLLGRTRDTLWLKYTGILLCLIFSLLCREKPVTLALAFTAAADWFLLIRNDHWTLGIILFLCVQTLYALHLCRAGAPLAPRLRMGLALALILVVVWLNAASSLNLLAVLYFSQLAANAILAWRLPSLKLFALGLTLFLGCDLCVGLYHSTAFVPALIGIWFFYLPSQVLIVLSAKEAPHENK